MCIYVWENDQVHQPTQIIIILCSARRAPPEYAFSFYYYINAERKVEHQQNCFHNLQCAREQKGHCMRASVDEMDICPRSHVISSPTLHKKMRGNSQHFAPN
jgi:hypothetical protein